MSAANLFSFYFNVVGNEKGFCKDYYWLIIIAQVILENKIPKLS